MVGIRNTCCLLSNKILCIYKIKRCYVADKAVPPNVPYLTHNDGTKIPHIGLGTYKNVGNECENAVKIAIDNGYRSIDTAYFYQNEDKIGKAICEKISEGVIKREDIFVTTKLWNTFHDPNYVEHACRLSLKNLGLDYVNLYLMHWPMAYAYQGDDMLLPVDCDGKVIMSNFDYVDTWKAMEKLVDLCLTKSIGVSNFNIEQLTRLISKCRIKPVQNQIEFHPMLDQTEMIEFCQCHCILVTAHSPFARQNPANKTPNYLHDAKVLEIAKCYNKTPVQIVLRYLIERGTIPLPKSVNKDRIIQNIGVFDFELQKSDHAVIAKYHTGERVAFMAHGKHSIYYPFRDVS